MVKTTQLAALKNGQIIVGTMSMGGRRMLLIKCRCGDVRLSSKSNAARSHSCGCMTNEILRAARTVHGHSKGGNGNGTPTFKSWKSMCDRCSLPSHKSFKDYGGRGIGICEKWQDFRAFLQDMGERPPGKQIGRINNERGYEPANCRWETPQENCNNKRGNHILEYAGKKMTLAEWARVIGLRHDTLSKRLSSGWPISEALTRAHRLA